MYTTILSIKKPTKTNDLSTKYRRAKKNHRMYANNNLHGHIP